MQTVFLFTIKGLLRNRLLPGILFLLLLFSLVSSWNQATIQASRWQAYQAATKAVRTDWEHQGPQNPHSSAHYGHYAFLPVSPVQAFDPGIMRFTGTMLRLEGHMQHEPAFSSAGQQGVLSRFPEISLAWMVHTLFPLFIFLMGFGLLAGEREQQRLKWEVLQGVTPRQLLWGKWLALSAVAQALLVVITAVQWTMAAWLTSTSLSGQFYSILSWWLGQLLYLEIFVSLSLLISAWSRTARQSLMVSLSVWLIMIVLIPRLAADWSARQHPLPARVIFNRQLAEDRKKGINGHDPQDERAKKFEDSLLRHYGVDSLSKLPVNADGLIMQADEVYSNQVYDIHFGRVREQLMKQISLARWFGAVSPVVSAQHLSMGACGTDVHAYLQFTRTAEDYRRYLIEALNLKMAYGGSKTGDWEWTVDESYFKSLRDYTYTPMLVGQVHRLYAREWILLTAWLFALLIGLFVSSRRMSLI